MRQCCKKITIRDTEATKITTDYPDIRQGKFQKGQMRTILFSFRYLHLNLIFLSFCQKNLGLRLKKKNPMATKLEGGRGKALQLLGHFFAGFPSGVCLCLRQLLPRHTQSLFKSSAFTNRTNIQGQACQPGKLRYFHLSMNNK